MREVMLRGVQAASGGWADERGPRSGPAGPARGPVHRGGPLPPRAPPETRPNPPTRPRPRVTDQKIDRRRRFAMDRHGRSSVSCVRWQVSHSCVSCFFGPIVVGVLRRATCSLSTLRDGPRQMAEGPRWGIEKGRSWVSVGAENAVVGRAMTDVAAPAAAAPGVMTRRFNELAGGVATHRHPAEARPHGGRPRRRRPRHRDHLRGGQRGLGQRQLEALRRVRVRQHADLDRHLLPPAALQHPLHRPAHRRDPPHRERIASRHPLGRAGRVRLRRASSPARRS